MKPMDKDGTHMRYLLVEIWMLVLKDGGTSANDHPECDVEAKCSQREGDVTSFD
jgi:hypothetical protein